jgi:hypothetical protein
MSTHINQLPRPGAPSIARPDAARPGAPLSDPARWHVYLKTRRHPLVAHDVRSAGQQGQERRRPVGLTRGKSAMFTHTNQLPRPGAPSIARPDAARPGAPLSDPARCRICLTLEIMTLTHTCKLPRRAKISARLAQPSPRHPITPMLPIIPIMPSPIAKTPATLFHT